MTYEEFLEYQRVYLPFGDPSMTERDLLDFESSEYLEDLLQSANFYIEAIESHSYYLDSSCKLFFVTNNSINAKASISHGRGAIILYGGLLLNQLSILGKHQQIFDVLNTSNLSSILTFLDNHPSILYFQFAQHFVFYHEFGHIIQFQTIAENHNLNEMANPEERYDIFRHAVELDADEFSSLCLATHIFQYADRIFEGDLSENELMDLISFFNVPVLIFFLNLYPNDIENLELKRASHPHPLFRIFFVSIIISEFANQRYEEFNINYTNIIDKTLEVTRSLTDMNLIDVWAENFEAFIQYFREIRAQKIPRPYRSAVDAWNHHI